MNYFIAGTDTDVGKTLVTSALLLRAQQEDKIAFGMKPIAAGGRITVDGMRNADAEMLIEYSSEALRYSDVNPFCFEPAIAPHIAAAEKQQKLSAEMIADSVTEFLSRPADLHLVEGAGGWYVPLNPDELFSGVVQRIQLPVILVVGLKLGCLNHALLTAEAICKDGLKLAGWVANQCQVHQMSRQQENLNYLESCLDAPCLGVIPFLAAGTRVTSAARYISLPKGTV